MASYLDPAFEADRAQIEKQRRDALDDVAKRTQSTEQEYGFADTSNPFSRLNELTAGFERLRRFTSAQMGAGGYGYDGSYTATQDSNSQGHLRDRDSLQRAYSAAKSGLTNEGLAAENNYTSSTNDLAYRRAKAQADAVATGEDQYLTPEQPPAPAGAGGAQGWSVNFKKQGPIKAKSRRVTGRLAPAKSRINRRVVRGR